MNNQNIAKLNFYLFFKIHFILVVLQYGCFGIDPLIKSDSYICPNPVASAYDRGEHFGDWIDEDGDGEDTRWEVLIEENIGSPDFILSNNKKIFKDPKWVSFYSGLIFTDPDELDIDHLVPTKEAWISGACFWDQDQRVRFFNFLADPNHLIAVEAILNRQKGASDPIHWMPNDTTFHKNYLLYWAQIKANWGLTTDEAEYQLLRQNLGSEFPMSLKVTSCVCK